MGVDIVLHQAVVFLIADFSGEKQIPALKSTLKQESSVFLTHQFVARTTVATVFNKPAITKFFECFSDACI